MPKQEIPERQPISDVVTGVVSQFDNRYLLSSTPLDEAVSIDEGAFFIRYGIPYLGKPHYSIVPDLVVVDYGDMLVGEDAWVFLTQQSNLYPRSDVLGYRNDGKDEMLVVKQLDFALPFEVLVYKSESDVTPMVSLSALITRNPDTFPDRLLKYLQQYNSLADWQS